jgi:UTP--glucose-1-phosphate uridylyltransferase
MVKKIRKAVIPAAGLGTRFLPATKALAKEMIPVVDKPLIQYMIEEAAASGIEQVVLVVSRGKDALASHFDAAPELEETLRSKGKTKLLEEVEKLRTLVEIVAVRQHRPLGLGHAIGCAKWVVGDEPFVVLLPDDMIDNPAYPACRQMMDVYEKYGKSVMALIEVPPHQMTWYGMIKFEPVSPRVVKILDAIEKPKPGQAPSSLGIVSRYLFTPEIFPIIDSTPPGANGEIQITDGIARLAREQGVYGLIFEGERFDAGDKLGFLEATVHYALKHPEVGPEFRELIKKKLGPG